MAVNYGQVAIVPKGAWNAETQYKVNNLVSYDGSSYVAKVQPPVGTLPTDTSYWQVSAAGTKKATADSLGTVMPDGTTTSVGEDGKLSVNTAQQDALGVVKGSDDITVGEDGTPTVNTTFEQATELANIIAGEAIKSVLGKVSKAIATTMSLDENALLKNMISGIDVNDSNKVPSSAYIHTLVERIGMGTELVSGLGDLTTGLNTVNNNLSNVKKGITVASWGTILQCQKDDLIRRLQLAASTDDVYLAKSTDGGTNFTILGSLALKSDLEKQASFEPYVLNTNASEYIKSLSAGKVHFFKTSSGTSGNPYTRGSCFYMVYIIDTSHNGIGLVLNHSTTAYFMRISLGDVVYTKLSA